MGFPYMVQGPRVRVLGLCDLNTGYTRGVMVRTCDIASRLRQQLFLYRIFLLFLLGATEYIVKRYKKRDDCLLPGLYGVTKSNRRQ